MDMYLVNVKNNVLYLHFFWWAFCRHKHFFVAWL